MKKNDLIVELNTVFYDMGYNFFKYKKGCRIYKKIKPDNSICYIKVNMETCNISKKECIYNNLTTEELIACKYIADREIIERINDLGGI